MCEPVSLTTLFATTLAVSAASAGAGLIGQAQQYNANKNSAEQSFRLQNRQTNLGIQQSEAAASQRAQQTQTDMLKAAATAAASAGENGVSGNSVDALINDYHSAEGKYLSDLTTQNQWNRAQADVQKQGQAANAQRQINSVAKPDFIGAALRVAGDGLNSYTNLWAKDATR